MQVRRFRFFYVFFQVLPVFDGRFLMEVFDRSFLMEVFSKKDLLSRKDLLSKKDFFKERTEIRRAGQRSGKAKNVFDQAHWRAGGDFGPPAVFCTPEKARVVMRCLPHPAAVSGKYHSFQSYDVRVKRWSSKPRLVKLHKRLGHALALPSLACGNKLLCSLYKAAKNQRPSTWHAASPSELRKALRLFVQLDESQSLYDTFDLYIIL